MKRNPVITVLMLVCAAVALLHVARFAAPESALGSAPAGTFLLIFAGWIKLAALAAATFYAWRCAALLDRDNPARRPWLVLAIALGFFSLGQATLTWFQTRTGQSPFPSIADAWFMISYPLLIVALAFFIAAYARSGFPVSGLVPLGIGLLVIAAAAAWPLLGPIARTRGAPLAIALNLAYPALDLLLLVPTIVLLRLTIGFRGGAVWHIWAALVAGFAFTAIGDIAFAYFSTLNYTKLDPLTHAMYIVAYGSLAFGTAVQYRLLAPEAPAARDLVSSATA